MSSWNTGLAAREVPPLTGSIVDQAGYLNANDLQRIEASLLQYQQSSGNQIAVLVIDSLEGESLEQFSLRTAESWALGQKGLDNGVLLLLAIQDRKLRIEVGYGLEEKLPDARCKQIIDQAMVPRLKQGNYPAAIQAGVDAIINSIGGTDEIRPDSTAETSAARKNPIGRAIGEWAGILIGGVIMLLLLFGFLSFLYYLFLAFVRTRGTGTWIAFLLIGPLLMLIPAVLIMAWIKDADWFVFVWGFLCVLFLAVRLIVQYSRWGSEFVQRSFDMGPFEGSTAAGSSSGSSWSSSSGSSSSYSGGGGSFGGGGASGSW
ncbi:MAG: TPM domain-containing protein [Leptospiraceae bacterium]|nr:TPM domain-containing protein [Leptospiraceae bacterium]